MRFRSKRKMLNWLRITVETKPVCVLSAVSPNASIVPAKCFITMEVDSEWSKWRTRKRNTEESNKIADERSTQESQLTQKKVNIDTVNLGDDVPVIADTPEPEVFDQTSSSRSSRKVPLRSCVQDDQGQRTLCNCKCVSCVYPCHTDSPKAPQVPSRLSRNELSCTSYL